MSIEQELVDLAQKMRVGTGELSSESLLLLNASQLLGNQSNLIRRYESETEKRVERSTVALERIACAIQQATMYGWGSVTGEDLGPD